MNGPCLDTSSTTTNSSGFAEGEMGRLSDTKLSPSPGPRNSCCLLHITWDLLSDTAVSLVYIYGQLYMLLDGCMDYLDM